MPAAKTSEKQLAEVKAAVQSTPASQPVTRPYAVMMDAQGVAYLRVESTPKGAKFLLNTGTEVELIEMPADTIRSRALEVVPDAQVEDAAKILARPLTDKVIISKRAKPYLDKILADKEFLDMAKAKASKKPAHKAAASKAAPKKAAANANGHAGRKSTIDERFAVVEKVLKGHKGPMPLKDFRAALDGKFANRSAVKAELVKAKLITFNAKERTVELA